MYVAQLATAVKYIEFISADGWNLSPPISILDITLDNLMVRF